MSATRVFFSITSVVGLGLFGPLAFAQSITGDTEASAEQEGKAPAPANVDSAGPVTNRPVESTGQAPQPARPAAAAAPTPPPFVPVKTDAGIAALRRPVLSVERETTAWPFERAAGINALGLYSGQFGLLAGGELRLLGFLTLSVGYQRLPTGQTAMMAGGGIVAFNVNGFDLSLWNVFANLPEKENKPTMQSSNIRLGIPLYARWLPLRIPSTRLVITCEVLGTKTNQPIAPWQRIGVGLEVGVL
jgi:hypothetical protein